MFGLCLFLDNLRGHPNACVYWPINNPVYLAKMAAAMPQFITPAAINAPAWHDSKVARPAGGLDEVINKLPIPYCVLADAVFGGSVTGTTIL